MIHAFIKKGCFQDSVSEAAHENAKAFHDKCENKDLRVCAAVHR